jgi:hypothetical protein
MQPNARPRSALRLGPLVLLAACTLASTARAEMRVIESNTPRYPVDSIVQNIDKTDLGQNCYVRALKFPANQTILFEGPKSSRLPVGGTRGKRPPPC